MTNPTKVPKAPAGLGTAGRATWRGIIEAYELDPRELMLLATAAKQADLLAALEKQLADDGLITIGYKGQERLSALPAEIRQGRLAMSRLLGELRLPNEGAAKPMTARSRRAQHAADSRWSRVAAEEASRRGA